jgi:hypothetical protein
MSSFFCHLYKKNGPAGQAHNSEKGVYIMDDWSLLEWSDLQPIRRFLTENKGTWARCELGFQ